MITRMIRESFESGWITVGTNPPIPADTPEVPRNLVWVYARQGFEAALLGFTVAEVDELIAALQAARAEQAAAAPAVTS